MSLEKVLLDWLTSETDAQKVLRYMTEGEGDGQTTQQIATRLDMNPDRVQEILEKARGLKLLY